MNKKTLYKFILISIQGFISFLSIIIYVLGTYYDDDSEENINPDDEAIIQALKWLEVFIAVVITMEYTVKLIRVKNKWEFIFKFLNILDVIAVIPTYLGLILSNFKGLGFTRIFRMVRLLRILKIYKTVTDSRKDRNEEEKNVIFLRLLSAIFTVLAFVFLSTGIVHFLNQNLPDLFKLVIPSLDSYACKSGAKFDVVEYEPYREGYKTELRCMPGDPLVKVEAKMTFDLVFYYMVITMATVGYGDIYPDTSLMRLVMGVFVILSIITISKQTSELNDLIKLNSEYQVAYKESRNVKHILLSGFFNKSSLIKFLNEFYHSDHQEKSENIKIIIIQSDYPDKEIQSILLNPKFEENLHYIIGDIFSENTLKLANAKTAETIFLISDQHHTDSVKNDQYLILACKALSQYSSAKIFIQFNHSQFLLHEWVDWDLAFSSQKIKMNIIVKNSFISGLSTMMMNLSSSSSSIYNYEVHSPWMLEYIHGASQEIYIIDIPETFEECPLHEFILKSYFNHRSLVIGVKKKILYQEDKDIFYFIYLLNPIEYILSKEDSLIIISATYESAKEIFNKTSDKKTSFEKFKNNADVIDIEVYKEYFRDENLNIKKKKKLKSEEEKLKKSPNKRFNNFSDEDKSFNEEFEIPEIFRNRQYFKIWENNPIEFENNLINHYIIFCKEEQLWEFMVYFNQYNSDIIFFISDQHPSNKILNTKRYFKNLVYIECSYSDQDDLIRLNLEKAKHVFILTYTVENSNVSDSGILPLIKIIEENFPDCNYTLELSDELNIRYMNNKGIDSDQDEEDIDMNVMSDRHLNNLERKNKIKNIPVRLLPKYAKSDIFFCSSMESLLAFSYHNEGFLEVLSKILGIDTDTNNTESKNVENSSITMFRYIGDQKIKYEYVINYFITLERPIIPIAIYRLKEDSLLKNKSPYIITNPEKNFMLNRLDRIICIGETSEEDKFESFYESDFDESYLKKKNWSDSVSSDDCIPYDRRGRSNKETFKSGKEINKQEELENLNEEEILEKLKSEIMNLKYFSNFYKNSQEDDKQSSEKRLNQESFEPTTVSNFMNLNKPKKNFFEEKFNYVIEEKNEENEENQKNSLIYSEKESNKLLLEEDINPKNAISSTEDNGGKSSRKKVSNLKQRKSLRNKQNNFIEEINTERETNANKNYSNTNIISIQTKNKYDIEINREESSENDKISFNQVSKFKMNPNPNNENLQSKSRSRFYSNDGSSQTLTEANKSNILEINQAEKNEISNKEGKSIKNEDDYLNEDFFCLEKNTDANRLFSGKLCLNKLAEKMNVNNEKTEEEK